MHNQTTRTPQDAQNAKKKPIHQTTGIPNTQRIQNQMADTKSQEFFFLGFLLKALPPMTSTSSEVEWIPPAKLFSTILLAKCFHYLSSP